MRQATVLAITAVAVLIVAATFLVELSQEPRSVNSVRCTDSVAEIEEGSTIPSGGTYASLTFASTYTATTNASTPAGHVVSLATTITTRFGYFDLEVDVISRTCTYVEGSGPTSGT